MSRYQESRKEVNDSYWRAEHREHSEQQNPESLTEWRARQVREIAEGFEQLKTDFRPF